VEVYLDRKGWWNLISNRQNFVKQRAFSSTKKFPKFVLKLLKKQSLKCKMFVPGPRASLINPSLNPASKDNLPYNQTSYAKSKDQVEEQRLRMAVEKLKRIEARVIAHEMAHKVVGGQYAGSVRYEYTRGPDGRLYITGGEVSIDVSEEPTPEETIQKMEIVRRAALAPADPSPQDLAVAQTATIKEMRARLELWRKKFEELEKPSQQNNLSKVA
jgi:hypothetical protein